MAHDRDCDCNQCLIDEALAPMEHLQSTGDDHLDFLINQAVGCLQAARGRLRRRMPSGRLRG